MVRNRFVQRGFLATPLAWRRRIAADTQSRTRASAAAKAEHIMDVDHATVQATLKAHDATQIIHGHTHRPATHEFEFNGQRCRRIVLGDWYADDEVVTFANGRFTRERVADYLA